MKTGTTKIRLKIRKMMTTIVVVLVDTMLIGMRISAAYEMIMMITMTMTMFMVTATVMMVLLPCDNDDDGNPRHKFVTEYRSHVTTAVVTHEEIAKEDKEQRWKKAVSGGKERKGSFETYRTRTAKWSKQGAQCVMKPERMMKKLTAALPGRLGFRVSASGLWI